MSWPLTLPTAHPSLATPSAWCRSTAMSTSAGVSAMGPATPFPRSSMICGTSLWTPSGGRSFQWPCRSGCTFTVPWCLHPNICTCMGVCWRVASGPTRCTAIAFPFRWQTWASCAGSRSPDCGRTCEGQTAEIWEKTTESLLASLTDYSSVKVSVAQCDVWKLSAVALLVWDRVVRIPQTYSNAVRVP